MKSEGALCLMEMKMSLPISVASAAAECPVFAAAFMEESRTGVTRLFRQKIVLF